MAFLQNVGSSSKQYNDSERRNSNSNNNNNNNRQEVMSTSSLSSTTAGSSASSSFMTIPSINLIPSTPIATVDVNEDEDEEGEGVEEARDVEAGPSSSVERPLARGLTMQKLTRLRERLKLLDSKERPRSIHVFVPPEDFGLRDFSVEDAFPNLEDIIKPNMTPQECQTAIKDVKDILQMKVAEPVQQLVEDSNRLLKDLREQLIAEIRLREITEEHQQKLEKELDYLRSRMDEQEENVDETTKHFSFTRYLASRFSVEDNSALKQRLRTVTAERDSLRAKIFTTESLYSSMVESRSQLFFQKELLTLELENLTQELFEEANRMVATEARLRAELQSSNQILSQKLESLMAGLQNDLTSHLDRVSPAGRNALREKVRSQLIGSPPTLAADGTLQFDTLTFPNSPMIENLQRRSSYAAALDGVDDRSASVSSKRSV